MLQTNNFEILLPNDFISIEIPKWDEWDFKCKLHVFYSCDATGGRMEIYNVTTPFAMSKFILWEKVELEKYLLKAAENNWESKFTPKDKIIISEENAKTLHY